VRGHHSLGRIGDAFARAVSVRRRCDDWHVMAGLFRKSVGGGRCKQSRRLGSLMGSLTRRLPAPWCGRPNHERAGQTACGGLWRTPANGPDLPGRQGVRGSSPLSSTHWRALRRRRLKIPGRPRSGRSTSAESASLCRHADSAVARRTRGQLPRRPRRPRWIARRRRRTGEVGTLAPD
jgi:hypothetical protein